MFLTRVILARLCAGDGLVLVLDDFALAAHRQDLMKSHKTVAHSHTHTETIGVAGSIGTSSVDNSCRTAIVQTRCTHAVLLHSLVAGPGTHKSVVVAFGQIFGCVDRSVVEWE